MQSTWYLFYAKYQILQAVFAQIRDLLLSFVSLNTKFIRLLPNKSDKWNLQASVARLLEGEAKLIVIWINWESVANVDNYDPEISLSVSKYFFYPSTKKALWFIRVHRNSLLHGLHLVYFCFDKSEIK